MEPLRLRLYNTLSREKEIFKPLADPATMYVCGVTPYDTTHLGHARTYLLFDVLQRYLAHQGIRVRYVQNITDVDDPLFARARDRGVDYRELAAQYIAIFQADLRELNIMMPALFPRVSTEIPHILDTIQILVERGMAYPRAGFVYFRTARFPRYGAMSRLERPAMLAAQRETGEDPDDPNKEQPLDFRLWRPSEAGEPTWDSPWGPGRPGWHIECSTMATRHLGSSIDIHGGGEDLVFPHHCSEIAQSESANGEAPYVRYWMHVALVAMDGDKMSKSKGNMAFARELLPIYGADALRYYLLGTPYRQPLEYFEHDLAAAAVRWRKVAAAAGPAEGDATILGQQLVEACLAALDDDLNTADALARVDELASAVQHDGLPGDRHALRSLLALLGFRLT
jgi:L-cysteine:1D-myo-inositol 2-amino-2-deoxy-alpha-D-glucopyranoside ligase